MGTITASSSTRKPRPDERRRPGSASGVTGLTTAQARQSSSYKGWNFTTDCTSLPTCGDRALGGGSGRGGRRGHRPQHPSARADQHQPLRQIRPRARSRCQRDRRNICRRHLGAPAASCRSVTIPPEGGFQWPVRWPRHVINGLTINRPTAAYIGLFGALATNGKVQNIGLSAAVFRAALTSAHWLAGTREPSPRPFSTAR